MLTNIKGCHRETFMMKQNFFYCGYNESLLLKKQQDITEVFINEEVRIFLIQLMRVYQIYIENHF